MGEFGSREDFAEIESSQTPRERRQYKNDVLRVKPTLLSVTESSIHNQTPRAPFFIDSQPIAKQEKKDFSPKHGSWFQELGRFLGDMCEGFTHGNMHERFFIAAGFLSTILGAWFALPFSIGTGLTVGMLFVLFPEIFTLLAKAAIAFPILIPLGIAIEVPLVIAGVLAFYLGTKCLRKPTTRLLWVTVEEAAGIPFSITKFVVKGLWRGLQLDALRDSCMQSKNSLIRGSWNALEGGVRGVWENGVWLFGSIGGGIGNLLRSHTPLGKLERWIFDGKREE